MMCQRSEVVAVVFVGAMAMMGCCGNSGDSGASSATYASALDSCSAYCEAYFAAACTPAYTTSGQCKIDKCSPIPSTASAGCNTATKSWYDCLHAQSDICGTGCTDQAAAVPGACP